MRRVVSIVGMISALLILCGVARLQDTDVTYFVSTTGNDSNDGLSYETAFRTVTQAWNSIPQGEALTKPYAVLILAGTYTAEDLPNYWESRYGTESNDIIFTAYDGPNTVYLPAVNLFDSRYITFDSLNFELTEGDPFHCEKCEHIAMFNNVFKGADPETYATQETIKFNQSQYIDLNGNDISGAWDNAIDFVSVQYATLTGNKIHNAGDWCAYTKGGSAYITLARNEIYDCGVGGYTAGQGTGFQFMSPPWIQYEAYFVMFENNVVHDVEGAGVGVQGGYDVIIRRNFFYKVGERSHTIEIGYGLRTCDGQPGDDGRERCAEYRDAGGWGNDVVDDGTLAVRIPNKNVYIYENMIYNPAPYKSAYQHFSIFGPFEGTAQDNSNLSTVHADENLQIRENTVWNGDTSMPLGVEPDFSAGCPDDNPTCNAAQLVAQNTINTLEPQYFDFPDGDFSYVDTDTLFVEPSDYRPVFLPAWDAPVPPPDDAYFAYPTKK